MAVLDVLKPQHYYPIYKRIIQEVFGLECPIGETAVLDAINFIKTGKAHATLDYTFSAEVALLYLLAGKKVFSEDGCLLPHKIAFSCLFAVPKVLLTQSKEIDLLADPSFATIITSEVMKE